MTDGNTISIMAGVVHQRQMPTAGDHPGWRHLAGGFMLSAFTQDERPACYDSILKRWACRVP